MSVLALIALGYVGWAFLNSDRATAGIREAPFPRQPPSAPGTGAQSTTGNRFHRSNRNQCGSCRTPRTMLGTPWVPRPRHGPGPIMDPLTAGPRASAAHVIGTGPLSGKPLQVCHYVNATPGQTSGVMILTCTDDKGAKATVKPKCFEAQTQGPPKEVPCDPFGDL